MTTTSTTTTTTVPKSTTFHTPVQCNALGGDNVEWIDGTHLDLGCLGYVRSRLVARDAEEFCATSLDSHLVEIYNQDQQDFITQKAKQIRNETSYGGFWWIGLKRARNSSTWKWIYSNQAPNYTSWANAEWAGACTKFCIFCLR